MSEKNRKKFLFSLLIALLLVLSACGNDNASQDSGTKEENPAEKSEVTLDSEMGEVTIPADAERIIAPFHEDALLALGVTPVAKWAIGETLQNHLEDQLSNVPKIEWTMPLEQVLSYEPDLIILENNLDSYEGTYEEYNKIAPTYIMTEETTGDWRKQIETFGKLLGKEQEAEQAITGYEEKIDEASAQLDEAIGDETVAAIWVIGGQFFLFEKDRHSAEVLYSELGVNYPSLVEDLGEAQATWDPISLEKLSELDADHVFLLAAEGEEGLETLENSDVWQSIPAEQNGNVYVLNKPDSWTNTGLHASEQTIDAVLDTLVK
ncbi:ferrichrome ABC transporter substrate-binding protein [Oceanobacillus piezotolerans]|uniref:Ferrichrome ABC transporter substrate-binding protein n=1 Tax=Oceanobacillus piezotolerans TaxID=2448030 RepID=A0A498D7T5_9BACI|nr:ABC transporter substrate-binding protein [Oceanobacillus piezotolerans]RLL46586.1 ferrichrome ABC transporter substrate-binding protein [Oceanobacillus piezotolerans]